MKISSIVFFLLVLAGCTEPVDVRGSSVYDACEDAIDAADRTAVSRECARADQISQMLGIEPTPKMQARWERAAALDPCHGLTADVCECGAIDNEHPFLSLPADERKAITDACPPNEHVGAVAADILSVEIGQEITLEAANGSGSVTLRRLPDEPNSTVPR